jgi:hypothetical protein
MHHLLYPCYFLHERYKEELRKIHGTDVDLRSVPFDMGATYTSGGGLRHGRYVNIYSLSSVKYYRLIIVLFIADLLWATVL